PSDPKRHKPLQSLIKLSRRQGPGLIPSIASHASPSSTVLTLITRLLNSHIGSLIVFGHLTIQFFHRLLVKMKTGTTVCVTSYACCEVLFVKVSRVLVAFTHRYTNIRFSIGQRALTLALPGPKGSVLTIAFELEGQRLIALNGGPEHKFSLAMSLFVNCKSQKEVDTLWNKLSAGGKKIACGWLTDKFGVAWQICPTILLDYLNDKNPTKAKNVMQAMMKMQKIDINRLKQAYRKK
ncbi:MAG: VOC family protein, partial [Limisphaerales bacterium]